MDGSPAWFLQGSFPDPGGRTSVDANGVVTVLPRPEGAPFAAGARPDVDPGLPPLDHLPEPQRHRSAASCSASSGSRSSATSSAIRSSFRPASAACPRSRVDSKDNLWVFQRKPAGSPQLMRYSPAGKLTLTVGDDVIGHADKAHGMAIDAEDNVCDHRHRQCDGQEGQPGRQAAPDHRHFRPPGRLGRGQGPAAAVGAGDDRLRPDGDIYIAQGHGNESPNVVDSDDPTNNIGAARVLHLDKTGKYIGQWFGHNTGRGKFQNAHGLGVDPKTGDVWVGDREDYRIVIFNAKGEYLRQIATENLVCAIQFDRNGEPWMASGQDGQFLKLDRKTGKVVGATGNGMGIGTGQFIEASYWVFDKQNNMWAGDTSVGRVTRIAK